MLLWNHFGYRKLACVLAALPVCLTVRWLLTLGPPAGWSSWSESARDTVTGVGSGSYGVLCCLWLLTLLSPLLKSPSRRVVGLASLPLVAAILLQGLPGVGLLLGGLWSWLGGGWRWSLPIGGALLRVVGLPLAAGTLVALFPDLLERVQGSETYRRLFISGRGHAAGWLGPLGTRRLTRPLPRTVPRQGGHRSPLLHLGRTLFESTFAGGQDVWLNENSHLITFARTGSGKFVSSIAANLALYQGSGIFTSLKPELADFAVGRRTDPGLFEDSDRKFTSLGVDPRDLTRARYHLPGGRSFVLDPTGQSVWPSARHNFLSEIDIRDPAAPALITALAEASFPDNPQQRDPFFTIAPRGLFAASMGHVLTTEPDPSRRTLSACADFCLGIDPRTRFADPAVFQENLLRLLQNHALGGFIQKSAAAVGQLGPEAFGGIFAELELRTRWLSDQRVREQVSGPSDFSYSELGDEDFPVSVFPVLPRSSPDLVHLTPWLRTHIELGLTILETRRERPRTEILTLFDEFRQYGQRISAIRRGGTTLREAGVKLWVIVQGRASLVETLGQDGANELESCSALEFFGTDQHTAEKIAQAVGKCTHQRRGRQKGGVTVPEVLDVVTPAEVTQELRKGSSIKYVFPATLPPLRLRRTAYKPLVTEEGIRYRGLPLAGHYDDQLSQYRYARRRA